MNGIRQLLASLHRHIWQVRLSEMSRPMAFLFKQVRIVLIVSRNFSRNKLQLQAAGLTFYTVLSVVPVVALAFAVAKGFRLEAAMHRQLYKTLRGHEEVVEQILLFANRMLENTKGGLLAAVGVLILLWTVMRLLANIERAFNEIWQVARGRSWIRKFTEYFSIMMVAPIMIILAGSITVVVSAELENLVAGFDVLQAIGPIIFFLIRLIPLTLIWLLFTFVYMVMPNTKVNFTSALIAGIIAGSSFQLLEWAYINFQVGVSRYNAIYGSFAALPLFLIWVDFSWLLTLVGAEVAYANQCVENIEFEIDENEMSQADKKALAVILAQHIFSAFDNAEPPPSARELSHSLDIPFGVTARILDLMERAHIVSQVERDEAEGSCFQPALNIEKVTISDVLIALDEAGSNRTLQILSRPEVNPYLERIHKLQEQVRQAPDNLLVKDMPPVLINGDAVA